MTGVAGGVAARHWVPTCAAPMPPSCRAPRTWHAMVSSGRPVPVPGRPVGGPPAWRASAGAGAACGPAAGCRRAHHRDRAAPIALEMQSRYLHPGWLQAQKAEGYAGTLQVPRPCSSPGAGRPWRPTRCAATIGRAFTTCWCATSTSWARPSGSKSTRRHAQSLERLVQAQRQGYWQADADTQNNWRRCTRS